MAGSQAPQVHKFDVPIVGTPNEEASPSLELSMSAQTLAHYIATDAKKLRQAMKVQSMDQIGRNRGINEGRRKGAAKKKTQLPRSLALSERL
jgi:hypothetical protein